jgi:hypothetical protein
MNGDERGARVEGGGSLDVGPMQMWRWPSRSDAVIRTKGSTAGTAKPHRVGAAARISATQKPGKCRLLRQERLSVFGDRICGLGLGLECVALHTMERHWRVGDRV